MNADWLTQLAPAHAPPSPPWWPPAPGWWILAALILLLCLGSRLWWQRSASARRIRLRRLAIAELERIRSLDAADRAPAIQRLMRRYAITLYGARTVAQLSGDTWLRFIQAHGGTRFSTPSGNSFLAAAYGKGLPDAENDWIQAAEAFIRHRPRKVSAT